MKVICITNKNIIRKTGSIGSAPKLVEGACYTVIEFTGYGYHLAEVSCDKNYGYDMKRFVPLSEIDETTFERNYKKELV